jgi:hypothetical protein
MKKIFLGQYKTKEGDVVTRSKIGSVTVVEIDENVNATSRESDKETRIHNTAVKPSKQERVVRIKQLISEGKTRTECKDTMYKEQFYFGNPNPPSAFAGDWNSIQ